MYLIGSGDSGAKTLAGILNLNKPTKNTNKYLTRLVNASEVVAEGSMTKAAKELKERENTNKVTISMDGTWNTRGNYQIKF